VLQSESRVNQMEIEIDDQAISLLALQQPMAGDLRLITSAIKINTDLERMGDLAASIVERSLASLRQPQLNVDVNFTDMANLVESMVLTSLDAFVKRDAVLARGILTSDDGIDKLRNQINCQMIELMKKDPATVERALDYILIARRLERVADHATNIAEDIIFMVKGIDVRHRDRAELAAASQS